MTKDELLTDKDKLELIKRFEILKTMYDNSDVHCPFRDYALEHWDKVDMNYFDTIL